MGSLTRLVQLIVFLYSLKEFTNIKCNSYDPDFASFDYCFLKSKNRTYKYLSIKVQLLQAPVTKVKVNVAIMRRYNGYKPYLYNVTVDACTFLKNPKSNPVAAYIHSFFKGYSNMNHSCPFEHDLVVEKVPINFINTQVQDVLPVPHGDYRFHSNWFAYDIKRATVDVFITIS
ncbi:uncharacterized protein LOC108033578 isoform X2 [Drosophila biarmipes]|uniref:uncharacterized protein LOC108033578 isoform X2 n=1 Tax=Drosophila biarmipes TaxID=125945 RepID=UPI0007E73466|nr:uncharacterized protein LOC108033578 isoform X2 [Drosophila biarmipes]